MADSAKTLSRKIGTGKHHRLDVKLIESGPEGILDFFSDRFTLHLDLKKGKTSGTAVVTENGFAARLKLSPRNYWDLEYTQRGKTNTMSVCARLGKITKSTNRFSVSHKTKNHDIKLAFNRKLGVNGHVTAKTRYLDFGLHFSKLGATAVELMHAGKDHSIKLKFFPNGKYEFKLKAGVNGGELTVEKKQGSLRAEASFSF